MELGDFADGGSEVPAGTERSFYVYCRKGLMYTASDAEGSAYGEDGAVVVQEGRATRGFFRRPTEHQSGRFAGVIRYRLR